MPSLTQLTYLAGEVINVSVQNVGKIDTTGNYTIRLADKESKIIYEVIDANLGTITAGNTIGLGISIPTNAVAGIYINIGSKIIKTMK